MVARARARGRVRAGERVVRHFSKDTLAGVDEGARERRTTRVTTRSRTRSRALTTQRDALAGQIQAGVERRGVQRSGIDQQCGKPRAGSIRRTPLISQAQALADVVDARLRRARARAIGRARALRASDPRTRFGAGGCTRMADGVEHALHLAVPALVDRQLDDVRSEELRLRRRGAAVLELDAVLERVQDLLARLAVDLRDVGLLDAVARVREPVCERRRRSSGASAPVVSASRRPTGTTCGSLGTRSTTVLRPCGSLAVVTTPAGLCRSRCASRCFAIGRPSTSTLSSALRRRCSAARARRSRGRGRP